MIEFSPFTSYIFAQYRRKNIRELAEYIINEAKSVNPNLIFSAATMPEGAYENAFSDLHYGQNYDDTASLYHYICPMAYSTNYGKTDDWVTTLAKNSIDKGNKVVMGIQVFDAATTSRIMAEMENIRSLMKDPSYGSGTLGTVFFRSGTFEYAKATYDVENKIITVKIINNGTSAYSKVRVEGAKGIKFTATGIGDGVNENAKATIASNGSYVTFQVSNLVKAGAEGYLYLKYEGEIDPDKLPVTVRLYRSTTESRVYTVVCDTNADNSDIGEPKFSEPETTIPETTVSEETTVEATNKPVSDILPKDSTAPAEHENEKTSPLLPIILSAVAGIGAIAAGVFVLLKKKKRLK